jgi:hypothetical protein
LEPSLSLLLVREGGKGAICTGATITEGAVVGRSCRVCGRFGVDLASAGELSTLRGNAAEGW